MNIRKIHPWSHFLGRPWVFRITDKPGPIQSWSILSTVHWNHKANIHGTKISMDLVGLWLWWTNSCGQIGWTDIELRRKSVSWCFLMFLVSPQSLFVYPGLIPSRVATWWLPFSEGSIGRRWRVRWPEEMVKCPTRPTSVPGRKSLTGGYQVGWLVKQDLGCCPTCSNSWKQLSKFRQRGASLCWQVMPSRFNELGRYISMVDRWNRTDLCDFVCLKFTVHITVTCSHYFSPVPLEHVEWVAISFS